MEHRLHLVDKLRKNILQLFLQYILLECIYLGPERSYLFLDSELFEFQLEDIELFPKLFQLVHIQQWFILFLLEYIQFEFILHNNQ